VGPDTVKGYERVLLSLGAYGSQQAIQEALVKKELKQQNAR